MTSKSNLDSLSFANSLVHEISSPWLDDIAVPEVVQNDNSSAWLESDMELSTSGLPELFENKISSLWLDDFPSVGSGLVQNDRSSPWLETAAHNRELSAADLPELFQNEIHSPWLDDLPSTPPDPVQNDMPSTWFPTRDIELSQGGESTGMTVASVDDQGNSWASYEPGGSFRLPKKTIERAPQVPKGRSNDTDSVDYDLQREVVDDKDLPCSHSLTCESHSESAKQTTDSEGRSRPYDELLFRGKHERPIAQPYSPPSQHMSQGTASDITTGHAESSEAYSLPTQHNFQGAHGVTMMNAVFNNVGGDQINQNVYHHFDLLWQAIRNVGASHNSEIQVERGHCLAGTREAVLRLIYEWRVSGCQSLPVCWLSGAAGVGKSAIALTVAKQCEKNGLVSSFFFFRSDPRRNNPSPLILSIAHGLVLTRPHLKSLVDQRIASNPNILEARLEDQYDELVLKCISLPSTQEAPDLVIIDGLDECSDAAIQRRVLSIIFSTYQHSPRSPLRFLICSRPESWIREFFESHESRDLTNHIKLDDSFLPQYDIELYYNKQFQDIRRDPQYSQVGFPEPWPHPDDVRLLVEKADGQFIYASTVMKFVNTEFTLPTDQLRIILDSISHKPVDSESTHSPLHDLDELYCIVLRANPDRDKHLLPILATILLLPEEFYNMDVPSSPAFTELLLGLSTGTVSLTLRAMHSVLDIRGWKDDIHIYHKSFLDFLFDCARSREFFIDKSKWRGFLACRWVRALTEQCQNDPELLRSYASSLDDSVQLLAKEWDYFFVGDENISNELLLELDNFYRTALSIASELGHDMLLHLLAAIHLLSRRITLYPCFIQLLFGLQREDLAQRLRALHRVILVESLYSNHTGEIGLRHSSFTNFLFDRSRSNTFFIDKDYYDNFLAQRCLHILQTATHLTTKQQQDSILLENWAWICSFVGNPTEELLSELVRMNLGNVINKVVDVDLELSGFMSGLYTLFRNFNTIYYWLKSQPSSPVLLLLTDRFETVQKGFHIQSSRQDFKSGLHDDTVAIAILSLAKWQESVSYRRPYEALDYYHSKEGRNLLRNRLSSATFCSMCSKSALDSDRITTPIPGTTELYHINIQAGCTQIFKVIVADLQSTECTFEQAMIVDMLLRHSTLLTRCAPRPELLPPLRMILETAQRLRRDTYREKNTDDARDRLLVWLESFPTNCARETEAIKNDVRSLFGK